MVGKRHRKACLAASIFCSWVVLVIAGCAEPVGTVKGTKFSKSEYERAKNAVEGGRLYSEWWEVAFVEPPTGSSPLWTNRPGQNPLPNGPVETVRPVNGATPGSNTGVGGGETEGFQARAENNSENGDTWSCARCHGWDYLGSAEFPNISSLVGLQDASDPKVIYEFIRNGVAQNVNNAPHRFGKLSSAEKKESEGTGESSEFQALSKQNIYDLTAFVTEIASLGSGDFEGGDPVAGEKVYKEFNNTGCETAGCHAVGEKYGPDDIKTVAQEEPAKLVHFVRFGGPIMPGAETKKTIEENDPVPLEDAKNVIAYLTGGAPSVDPVAAKFDPVRYDTAAKKNIDLKQGGLMYDKWWRVVASATEPQTTHPLWAKTANKKTGSATWRCKQCHGWDYRGKDGINKDGENFSGFPGVLATLETEMKYKTAGEVFAFLKLNEPHGFANRFNDEDYYALTRFVMEIRTEAAAKKASFDFIDEASARVIDGKYDIVNGNNLFMPSPGKNFCASCHGVDGKLIDFADDNPATEPNEFVDTVAKENPWEFIHKVRFGDRDTSVAMTGLIDRASAYNTIENAVDILAFAQFQLVPDGKQAGRLYDNWMTEKNVATPPSTNHPLWPTTNTSKTGAETWRCKNCHGWNYKGTNGIKGFIPATARLLDKTKTAEFIKIGDTTPTGANHKFGSVLTDEDINALADFISKVQTEEGIFDFQNLTGNVAEGQALYKGESPGGCSKCHGTDGTLVPTVDLGNLAKTNEPEVLHKVRFGSPASSMIPSSTGFQGLSTQQAVDVLAYVKTLSGGTTGLTYDNASIVRGGRLYDKWWDEMKVSDATVVAPTSVNPGWAPRAAVTPAEESWRCKSCHGWGYKGSPAGIPAENLFYWQSRTMLNPTLTLEQKRQNIFNAIKNGATVNTTIGHNFGTATQLASKLTDREIWDLTKFFFEGLVDNDYYTNPTDISHGLGLYTGAVHPNVNCASCHGLDGRGLVDKGTNTVDIFQLANIDTLEFLHKVRVGQPGTPMPAMLDPAIALSNDDARDIRSYANDAFIRRPLALRR